ncbi:Hypothetical predicted protein [Paramuricea clavata]|uniref:Peroxisomal membrane protein PEX14 n=1 Tax=Paramuricea clavata TaxID=317549 RepID=A0A6S7HC77_PARCT|nr:Hypothetical predicted protein [Paramuricea clavata]
MDDNAEEIKADETDQKSQKKIETAVKFLQNPRVQETPFSQRKAFLVKKGLTEDEIQKALELSQTADPGKDVIPRNPGQGQAVFPGQPPPFTLRLRDFFWVALVGGSFGYLLAHLVKDEVEYFPIHLSGKKR